MRPENGSTGSLKLKIEISGEVRGGNLVAGPPRRTLRQLLPRRSRP
jgi:hypothetical protein